MNKELIFIQESLHTFKPSERKVAEFILEKPADVINISIQKLAENTQVSEATIIRLSRSLRCKGFKELKLKIAYDLAKAKAEKNLEGYEDIPIDDSVSSMIHSVSQNNIQAIHNTVGVLDEAELEKAIELISKARIVAVYGIGASGLIAMDFKQKLTRINRWCEAAYDKDTQVTIAANLSETDVAFGISYSGHTKDIIESLKVAKENGASVITLTRSGENPTSAIADVKLNTTSLERNVRSGATSSRIAQLNVIDILFFGVMKLDQERNIKALDKTRKAVEASKRHV
ncbi:MurR/RpiR family transcriptional regulator [Sutcliffiella horikoshii]|uniref:MurR/RpiR family transcriptional regulator n=1 Tax=Sutcliffiella horikoshii TaxID=79883 RepID=A0A1Y0CT23_9BACI|nr:MULTISPECIES: MurR/RpiR family transcriptional regulator [Bacillaceae]ART78382.1 MurR/RpiR family transcriptional regulator [Sutcliffiella horikoshii]TYS70184.1 MurR/RpiR family transcriptional regulator [Sutcliffiella horikoshii]